jgi:integrase
MALDGVGGLGPRAAGPVFPDVGNESIKRSFIRAARRAGLEDFHFHDLRHEATTRFFERGLAMMEVASITGHRDPRKLRGYTHLYAESLARKLDD